MTHDEAIYMEKGERIDYFAPGELAALYADWLIVACEKRLIDCRQDGTIHRHSVRATCRARAPARCLNPVSGSRWISPAW